MAVTVRTRKSKSKGMIIYLDIIHEGRRKRMNLATKSLHEARRIAARMDNTLRLKGWIDEPGKKTYLSEFIEQYLAHGQATKAIPTCKLDEHALGTLIKFKGDVRLDSITHQDFETFRVHRLNTVKPTSVNAELRHIKAAFSFAVDIELLKTNPAQKVKLCKVLRNNKRRFLDQEEIKRLRVACDDSPDLKRMVDFALQTGLRRGEITSLEWRDIDFKRKMIHVQNKVSFRTKSGKDRQVPMNRQAVKLLSEMKATGPNLDSRVFALNYWWFGKVFKLAVREAKLPDTTTIHTLRHTFASHLVMQGVDLRSVKEILGHSDISVTMVYSHLSPDHLSETVDRIPY